jgi:putative flippase GtrA
VCIERIEQAVCIPHDIFVVYDFDEDTTVPVARELTQTAGNITLVKNNYGRGALNAIKTGMERAKSEYVVVTMADLSDPPEVINEMHRIAEAENAAIVCASRYMKGGRQEGGPFIKGLMSRIAGLTLRWFAKVATHDATNSFKLYRTSFLKSQKIESAGGFELGLELVAKAHIAGLTIRETPTCWTDRSAGKSNFKLWQWLPHYLNWYFYTFETPPKETDGAFAKIIKKYKGQFVKYALAGFFCALINWSVFYAAHFFLRAHYLAAGAAAFAISATVNYFLCKLIFASRGGRKRMEYLFVLLASAAALVLDLSVMFLLVEKFGLHALAAKIAGTASGFMVNYLLRQFLVFKSKI